MKKFVEALINDAKPHYYQAEVDKLIEQYQSGSYVPSWVEFWKVMEKFKKKREI
jgi:hypothetical protein